MARSGLRSRTVPSSRPGASSAECTSRRPPMMLYASVAALAGILMSGVLTGAITAVSTSMARAKLPVKHMPIAPTPGQPVKEPFVIPPVAGQLQPSWIR